MGGDLQRVDAAAVVVEQCDEVVGRHLEPEQQLGVGGEPVEGAAQ
eukprot:SAG11_NODE_17991_length_503_cov_0.650990_1_plen_44_part_01